MSVVRHLRCVYSTTLYLLPEPNIQSILIFMNLITKQVLSMYFVTPLLSNLSLNIHFRQQKNARKIHLYFSIRWNAP